MKYSVGQKVIVIEDGSCYLTYYNWVYDNNLCLSTNDKVRKLWSKFLVEEDNDCEVGTILTVVATGCHGSNSHVAMYLCEDTNGNPVLIGEPGLAPVEEKSLKWTDLKFGDVLKNKKYGYQLMITGFDKSDSACQHIYIGGNWISDSELAEHWEKVEE